MNKTFEHATCMPEHAEIRMTSTGPQGGDSGHGGWTKLTLNFRGGDAAIRVRDRDGHALLDTDKLDEPPGQIEIMVRGDWEMIGLELALRRIGLHLLQTEMESELENWR